ncbi:cysteine hydrolase family protein [Nonomuraea soli]|uniref:Nicotinamidase-related amidase n=1 Tax=Nonomuraea soli TaxID=1032476 RepID=A0A7W0HMZ6_9ACTN|nr:cysteine hydrolase family protein [Nonomuraea soli]MBA2889300.1 nicotinamidase-related amidase [Nonomuraea soli]
MSTTVSTTLREVVGLPADLPRLAGTTLVMIDYQNTYRTGVMALPGAEAAIKAGARLLERARAAGAGVVHIVNDGGPGTPYDIHAEIGSISPEVAPREGEPVVVKTAPNAFHQTGLERVLKDLGAGGDLVLAGFMTHMCVTFTAEGAFLRGYRPVVVADACATRTLAGPGGTPVDDATLHRAALTTIGDLFGLVVPTAAALED